MTDWAAFRTLNHKLGSFSLEIVRKKIKHIYFRVYPSRKKVCISVPIHLDRLTLENAVKKKESWILKKINGQGREFVSQRGSFLTEDTVWFKGKRYPVNIHSNCSARHQVKPTQHHIDLFLKTGAEHDRIVPVLYSWLKKELIKDIAVMVKKWEPRIGVKVCEYRIRKMRTRWGSCNIKAGRIWLNASLIHLPAIYLEYVVVHEMVHLIERYHNNRFKGYMDLHIPDWRQLKKQMDRYSLDD